MSATTFKNVDVNSTSIDIGVFICFTGSIYSGVSSNSSNHTWILDYEASKHICAGKSLLQILGY